MLRSIVKDRAQAMGWAEDDALALAASAFAKGNPIVDEEKLKALQSYGEVTGVSVDDSTDEAIADFLECCATARIEALADKAGSA